MTAILVALGLAGTLALLGPYIKVLLDVVLVMFLVLVVVGVARWFVSALFRQK